MSEGKTWQRPNGDWVEEDWCSAEMTSHASRTSGRIYRLRGTFTMLTETLTNLRRRVFAEMAREVLGE